MSKMFRHVVFLTKKCGIGLCPKKYCRKNNLVSFCRKEVICRQECRQECRFVVNDNFYDEMFYDKINDITRLTTKLTTFLTTICIQ